jgi:hypothetical protein
MIVQSDAGYATQVSTKPSSICESSRNDWSLWSTSPAVTLPAHDEQAPARQEYGRSMPASCEIERGTIGGSDGQRARRDRSGDGLAQSPRGPARSE